jgi:prevent-host-death family protein
MLAVARDAGILMHTSLRGAVMTKSVGVAEFKARCLSLVRQMVDDGEPLFITRRGKPVAVLSPVQTQAANRSVIGAMKGTDFAYHDPFPPAADAQDWDAN